MDRDIVLKFSDVSQWYGNNKVLHDIDLEIARGQFVALVGQSGCGKSTLLRSVQGTDVPKKGTVCVDGKRMMSPSRDVGMMYQHYNLYKFLTVEQNAALGLDLEKTTIPERLFWMAKWRKLRNENLEVARKWLTRFGLSESFELYPKQLSGGMKQRTSFVRSLVMEPKVLLLDEPFGAQDENTRHILQQSLLQLYQENLDNIAAGLPPQWTVVIITHETDEAFYVSDRIIGLSKNWVRGEERGAELGATVVFDKASPVYHPDDEKDFKKFGPVKKHLHDFVLSDVNPIDMEKKELITYWEDIEAGTETGRGVAI